MFERLMAARRARERQGGQVLVLFTLLLVVLLLASALAVDYGAWLVTKRSYQNVADAAALAGAQQLTRSLTAGKRSLARQAAWQQLKSQLGLSLDPASQAGASESVAYTENGYSIWVASPPADANAGCSSNCPYPGNVSGPGTVFVRVQRAGQHFLSRIAFSSDTPVVAWATAGRFPQNFAVEAMCDPNTGGGNCLVQGANIKIDGNNSLLAVSTGDLGTNSWTRTSGTGSAIGVGTDSNAYMGDFESCWDANGNQCNLYTYSSGAVDYSSPRNAVPLGAQIVDPQYPAPTLSNAATPWQCYAYGTQTVSMLESSDVAQAPVDLTGQTDPVVAQVPPTPAPVQLAAGFTIGGKVKNYWTGSGVNGLTVTFGALAPATTAGSGNAAGTYSISGGVKNTNYSTTVKTGATTLWGPTIVNSGANGNIADILILPYANVDGYVRDASTNAPIANATVTIAAGGSSNAAPSHVATTDATGHYTFTNVEAFDRTISVTAIGYDTPSAKTVTVAMVTGATSPATDFTMSKTVLGSIVATVKDVTTNIALSGVTVQAKNGGTTYTGTTDSTGSYTFSNLTLATWTVSATAPANFTTTAPANASTSITLSNATPQQAALTVWPQQCNASRGVGTGSWSCNAPCPNTSNTNAANVSCTFTAANAIRPGTYNDITIDGCAWIDPKGSTEGLGSGQSAGIVYIKGTLQMKNNSYLFGDGITIVMAPTATISVGNGGGFVLNYGSLHSTPGNTATSCDLSSTKDYGDGYSPCFRTTAATDTNDYAYAAWTSKGHDPWACSGTQATPPVYGTSCVTVGQELGVTFYLVGTPSGGSAHRFNISTANMGYLFNGVLYGPNDDIALGGGKDGQSAAGQIVGYTIEYHGGTKIIQRWYGDPVDGPPFLIEPILGECVVPVNACS